MDSRDYFVYIIECANGNFYTGYTTDIKKRVKTHIGRDKTAAKFTKSFKAVKMVACWIVSGVRGDALRVECFIKKCSRKVKEFFVADPDKLKIAMLEKKDAVPEIKAYEPENRL